MKLLIAIIAAVLVLILILAGIQAYQVLGRVCPACRTPGAQPDESGDPSPVPHPGDVTMFAFLAPAQVNPCWCAKCGNKWRIVRG